MQRLFAMLAPLTKPAHHAVPYMAPSYKAQNRNVAVIMFREQLRDAA